MKSLLLLPLILLASAAQPVVTIDSAQMLSADDFEFGARGTEHFTGLPPMRFRTADVAVPTLFVSDPDRTCGALIGRKREPGDTGMTLACVVRGREGGKPFVIMVLPNPCATTPYDIFSHLACHETGHMRGWNALHED